MGKIFWWSRGWSDLSNLVGKGVFKLWNDYSVFEKVYIGSHGEIAWSDKIDLCPDAIYLKITGKTPEQIFPNLQIDEVHAWNKSILCHHNQYFDDHIPPHFHAELWRIWSFGKHKHFRCSLENPARALGLVMEWASQHQDELKSLWQKARRLAPLE